MSKNPLFSTYRAGENRVTASMLAVFERVDQDVIERLLQAATEEAELSLVQFANQPSGSGSVPDAVISGSFKYLFEVKTDRESVDAVQLENHIKGLSGKYESRRLFVVTPDAAVPDPVTQLAARGEPVTWISFEDLDAAIADLLQDDRILIGEQSHILLRELRALFEQEGLVGQNDTVVVAARHAYEEYLQTAGYICQPGRSFQRGIKYMGFYANKEIKREIAHVRKREDNVILSRETATALSEGDELDRGIAQLIDRTLEPTSMWTRSEGNPYQIFLLSGANDDATIKLRRPVKHDHGAWTQSQRYTRSSALQAAASTADL